MKKGFDHETDNKLVHSSFRLEGRVLRALEKEAIRRGVTTSSLVNATLRNYVTCDMLFEELGFVLISKDFLRKIFGSELIDESYLAKAGRELGFTVAKEYVNYFFPDVTAKTVIEFLDMWLKRFHTYQHRMEDDRKYHTFTVNHDINMNFSIILRSIFEGLIEPIIKTSLDFKAITPNSISFSFKI